MVTCFALIKPKTLAINGPEVRFDPGQGHVMEFEGSADYRLDEVVAGVRSAEVSTPTEGDNLLTPRGFTPFAVNYTRKGELKDFEIDGYTGRRRHEYL